MKNNYHSKFNEVETLVKNNIPVLLSGERGTGKTTLLCDVAKSLGLDFYCLSMTRQTTLSHILGFINVNGQYVPTDLRKAAEFGGLIVLDELDAADSNVILSLNTIENGFITFPDKMIQIHKDFRIAATCNPADNHKDFNGRSKLDASTLDRFDTIYVDRDEDLEKSLVDKETYWHMSILRKILNSNNSSVYVSMRDSIRFKKRKDLDLVDGFVEKLLRNDSLSLEHYEEALTNKPIFLELHECTDIGSVWKLIKQ